MSLPRKTIATLAVGAVGLCLLSSTTTAVASRLLTGSDIQDGTITKADVADGTLTGRDVANGTLTGLDLRNGSVTGLDLRNGSITGTDIANGSITGKDIKNGTIPLSALDRTSIRAGHAHLSHAPIKAGGTAGTASPASFNQNVTLYWGTDKAIASIAIVPAGTYYINAVGSVSVIAAVNASNAAVYTYSSCSTYVGGTLVDFQEYAPPLKPTSGWSAAIASSEVVTITSASSITFSCGAYGGTTGTLAGSAEANLVVLPVTSYSVG